MYVPQAVKTVLEQTVEFAQRNDEDVPEQDRMNALDDYDATLEWLSSLEISGLPEFDESNAVKVPCTDAEPRDLFRPISASGSHTESNWKRFLGGEMTPNETWYFAMAYGDADTGAFEGVQMIHDSDWIELLTMCRVCADNQAEITGEVIVEGTDIRGPVCPECDAKYSSDGPDEH